MEDDLVPFDYEAIDTSAMRNKSDREILRLIKTCRFTDAPGWGYVAEICKRFEATVCDDDPSVGLCMHGQDYSECPSCRR